MHQLCRGSGGTLSDSYMEVTVCEIFFCKLTFLVDILQSALENIQSGIWFVFQMYSKEIKLGLHHYLFVKNISIPSHWTCLPVASSPY